jgi:hypothetical protein
MYADEDVAAPDRAHQRKNTGLPISGNPLWSLAIGHRITALFGDHPRIDDLASRLRSEVAAICGHSAQSSTQVSHTP